MTTFVLIDGAMAHGTLTALPAFTATDVPWFAALLPHEALRLAGPLLLEPEQLKKAPQHIQAEANKTASAFPQRLHLSLIDADLSLADMADHLRRFTHFADDQGEIYGLRIADCRVLAYLPQVLSESQWNALTAPIQRWRIHDRRGQQQELALNKQRRDPHARDTGWQLSSDQVDRLIDAGEADALLAAIDRQPEATRAADIERNFELAMRCVDQWRASGNQDRRQLVSLARRTFDRDRTMP